MHYERRIETVRLLQIGNPSHVDCCVGKINESRQEQEVPSYKG